FPHDYRTLNGRPGGKGGMPVNYAEGKIDLSLFDLDADVGETTDVKADHPDVVERLTALADIIRSELGDGPRKGSAIRPAGQIERKND
ncbi:MAG: arylsulfatase, partial [Planctomycetaceae bacterium]|nr:arylsulfatase [Planctomycetaceae bacterium]